MTPEFASLLNPTILQVLDLLARMKAGEEVDLAAERDRIFARLKHMEREAAGSSTAKDFDLAQRGVVYWIDEVMTLADNRWQEMTLEWKLYNRQDRAYRFFIDGESETLTSSGDVIELWYLALVLGFKGDLFDGFRQLNRRDFPPANMPEDEARTLWAKQLERLIPQRSKLKELERPVVERNVELLAGAGFLWTTGAVAAALFVLFGVLVYSHQWS
jgi:hypothetical protein